MTWHHVAALLIASGCASMLQPIPGMVHVATCKSGPAYHARGELICDDARDRPFAYRKLEPNDNAGSACVFCEGWRF
jgi:hypothetical protein